jgi:hypothetical protein
MSLLYRAIWSDDRTNLCEIAEATYSQWLASKGVDARPTEGETLRGSYDQGVFELVTRRAEAASVRAVQIELVEERPGERTRWTTRLTALESLADGVSSFLWVDNERVADDLGDAADWAAPRLVRHLIDSGRQDGGDPRVDQVRLFTAPHKINPEGLTGLIRHPGRTLPLVVFSEEPGRGYTPMLQRAEKAAARLAGAAQVMMLTSDAVAQFRDLIGDELAVWGGAVRVYLPNTGPQGLEPERHRYLPTWRLGDGVDRPARLLAALLGATITARRPPPSYDLVRRDLRLGRGGTDAELLKLAEAEIARLTQDRDDLKARVAQLENELLDTQVDLDDAVTEATRLQNQLQRFAARQQPGADDHTTPEVERLALEPHSVTEAVELARRLLPGVVIPEGVERDLEDLDCAPESQPWAKLTWQGLRALHLYAEAGFDGNFKQWCQQSGHAWAWRATDKKLAMRESETVTNNERLREQRRLPVDPAVDPSGSVLMWSHLKIAEGGGPLAPRVYFHDDTRGPTGKVHVGFIGPHRHMHNTRTS